MAGNHTFTAGDLKTLLNAAASSVAEAGTPVRLYVFGGAAMVLGQQANRTTTGDIDAWVESNEEKNAVTRDRSRIGKAFGLAAKPYSWLSVNQSRDMGLYAAHGDFDPLRPQPDNQALSVYLLKRAPQIALKLLTVGNEIKERGSKDIDDVKLLAKAAEIHDGEQLRTLWQEHKVKIVEKNNVAKADHFFERTKFFNRFRI